MRPSLSRLAAATAVAAGLALVPALPAAAHPHDHECQPPVDTNCYVNFFGAWVTCDYFVGVEVGHGGAYRCQQVAH